MIFFYSFFILFFSIAILFINVRTVSSWTFPFMGMFDWGEDLIPLIQSPGGNDGIGANSYNWLHNSSIKSFKLQYYIPVCLLIISSYDQCLNYKVTGYMLQDCWQAAYGNLANLEGFVIQITTKWQLTVIPHLLVSMLQVWNTECI